MYTFTVSFSEYWLLKDLSGRLAARASPLRGHHPDARSGRRRRADKADTSSEDGQHCWSSRATPLGVVAASTWLPHTVRRPDLALKYHRPCEAHEGSSGHVTMRDRRAYYSSRPPTAWDLLASRSVRAARLVLSDHCLLYTSPSPRDRQKSRMPSSA